MTASIGVHAGREERRAVVSLARDDWAILAFIGVYAASAAGLLLATGARQAFAFQSYLTVWPFVFLLLFPCIYGLLVLLRIIHRLPSRRGRLIALRRCVSHRHMQPFATGLLLLAAMMIFQGAFTSVKTALPLWHGGFPNDVLQADIDRAIHFGADPWRYLLAVGGNDWVRAFLEWNYNQGWFIVCYATLFLVAISGRASAIRTRYFVAYILAWIVVGNVLAGLALSAGPAFYGAITGDGHRFGVQLAFLSGSGDSVHSVTHLQTYLWRLYESGNAGFGSGISAFPSMHVGLATLNALFIAEASLRWGYVAFAYVALVLISSVYLAWHYAIDGYAAVAVTTAIYFATKRLVPAARLPVVTSRPALS
jgi:hypothetical protein